MLNMLNNAKFFNSTVRVKIAWCCCKLQYMLEFTAASCGSPCSSI